MPLVKHVQFQTPEVPNWLLLSRPQSAKFIEGLHLLNFWASLMPTEQLRGGMASTGKIPRKLKPTLLQNIWFDYFYQGLHPMFSISKKHLAEKLQTFRRNVFHWVCQKSFHFWIFLISKLTFHPINVHDFFHQILNQRISQCNEKLNTFSRFRSMNGNFGEPKLLKICIL